MALAIDIPSPSARAERNGVIRFIVRLFREKPLGAAGGVIFILFLLCGIFADVLAPYGMNQISPRNRLLAPSWAYPFGTDNLGRDMLSRCLYGAQISVIIAFTAASLATVVSIAIGILTGYLGGKIDLVTQRFVDAWMSFPDLIILLVVVSVLGPGLPQIIFTLGLLLGIGRLAHHPLRRGLGAREHVCARRAVDRRLDQAHPVAAHPAEHHAADHRAVHDAGRHRDPRRVEPVVSRPRRAAADPDLGRNAVGIRPHLHVPGTMAGACAGPVSDHRRLRHQRVRRRPARSARSAHARARGKYQE